MFAPSPSSSDAPRHVTGCMTQTINVFDGNLSRPQNKENPIKVLHFPPKKWDKLCPSRDLCFPGGRLCSRRSSSSCHHTHTTPSFCQLVLLYKCFSVLNLHRWFKLSPVVLRRLRRETNRDVMEKELVASPFPPLQVN